MNTVLRLDEIKRLGDVPQLIREIESGFVLYSQGQVNAPPVGFLHGDNPRGDVHIKTDSTGVAIQDIQIASVVDSGLRGNHETGSRS